MVDVWTITVADGSDDHMYWVRFAIGWLT